MKITVHGALASYKVGSSGGAAWRAGTVQDVAAALLGGAVLLGPRGGTVGPWVTAAEGRRGFVVLLAGGEPLPGVESWREYRGILSPVERQREDLTAFGAALVFVEVVGQLEAWRAVDRWRSR